MQGSDLKELSVAEVLDRWPQAALVFVHQGMACVGCDMASFEALGDAASIYHLDWEKFAQELDQAIQAPASGGSTDGSSRTERVADLHSSKGS